MSRGAVVVEMKQALLKLDQWDYATCKFIEIYAKYPVLYDEEHPLYGKFEDRQKTISDMRNALLSQNNIDFNEVMVSDALDQLHSWYYSTKRLKLNVADMRNKSHNNYMKMCKFLPEKRLKWRIECSICNKKFYEEHNFKYHLSKIHQVADNSLQCDQCGKKLISYNSLQCHVKRFHLEKKYSCTFCGKLFGIASELKNHALVHTAEKPYCCELCGKRFRMGQNLRLHVTRIHTKIREFKCTMCPKDYIIKSDLDNHIKAHLNIRDKICKICGKSFTNIQSLIRHRYIHSENKNFDCKLCSSKFYQFYQLTQHMKLTHKIVKKDDRN